MPYLVVAVVWSVLTWGNRWFVNPDGGVYAVMARRIAEGAVGDAVLAYWSPLFPVLAAPFVALGIQEFMALRLVLLLGALATIPILRRLCLRAGASPTASGLATTAGALLIGVASGLGLHPDVVFIPLILGCLSMALVGATLRAGLLVGVLGGLAYLTKAVALPYVAALLAMVLVLRLISEQGSGRGTLRMIAGAAIALALTAGPWIAVISAQSGHITISTAGEFNTELVAPGSWGNPLSFPGLYATPEGSFTPWEHPADLTVFRTSPENEEASPSGGNRVGNAVAQARVGAGSLLRRWTPVGVVAVVGMVVALRLPPRQRTVALGSLFAGAGFAAGMALLIVIERYLWFPMLALLPAAAVGLDAIGRWLQPRLVRSAGWLWAARGVAVLWLTLIAIGLVPAAFRLWNAHSEVWQLADQINQGEPVSGSLAGASDWSRSQLLAFLVDLPYAGLIDPSAPPSETEAQLAEVGAGAVVVWPGEAGETGELPPGSPPELERLDR